jgi:hypothetical protein
MALRTPSQVTPPPREAGGDNEVPRDNLGRPRIIVVCLACDQTGRVPSEKRPGQTVQCKRCKGEGFRLESYTRTTTFIDCIEDKSNLMAWSKRMVLLGAASDPTLLDGVLDRDPAVREDKDWLNRRAETAATIAGASEKAEKGTQLHALSELVDQGIELPDGVSFGDVIDMDAYERATRGFHIEHMERLVVLDEYRVAGTPDRISRWIGDEPLVAPDGVEIGRDELLITDLKTGTVEYGALKMAMQLAIYANSALYDKDTGSRESIGNINRRWGVIMNAPAGSGECVLYWADLSMGWEAVHVARTIRSLRSEGRNALKPLAETVAVGV